MVTLAPHPKPLMVTSMGTENGLLMFTITPVSIATLKVWSFMGLPLIYVCYFATENVAESGV